MLKYGGNWKNWTHWRVYSYVERRTATGMSCPLCIEKEMKKAKAWKDWDSWLGHPGDS